MIMIMDGYDFLVSNYHYYKDDDLWLLRFMAQQLKARVVIIKLLGSLCRHL